MQTLVPVELAEHERRLGTISRTLFYVTAKNRTTAWPETSARDAPPAIQRITRKALRSQKDRRALKSAEEVVLRGMRAV